MPSSRERPAITTSFVYDLSTGNLYQVTNTPGLDETLTNISVCNGIARVVYVVPAGGDFDLYAFTFQVPSSTANQIDDLIALVKSFICLLEPRQSHNQVTGCAGGDRRFGHCDGL